MREALEILPDDEGVLSTIRDLEALKSETVSKLAHLKADAASPPAPAATPSIKIDHSSNTPASPGPVDEPRVFAVNEVVTARYAGDRGWYPATIVSVMGSKTAPIYTVTFKGYTGTETVRAHEIRPHGSSTAAAQKRKADAPPAAPSPVPTQQAPAVFNSGSVMSAPATVNPALKDAAKRESAATLDDDSSKPKKKSRPNASVNKSQANWKSWQAKTASGKIAKVANKESMFRTGDKPGAKGESLLFGLPIHY